MAEARKKPMRHATAKAVSYDADSHSVVWVLSDETKDRDGEVIKADGWIVEGEPNVKVCTDPDVERFLSFYVERVVQPE